MNEVADQPSRGPLADWRPPQRPARTALEGLWCRLEPLAPEHGPGLFEAHVEDDGAQWRYLPVGPFADLAAYEVWLDAARIQHDPIHYAVRMGDGRLGGTLSLLRVDPLAGSAEVGWITYAPRLRGTREASEAVILLARLTFNLGYRRFEWKCNAANLASRRAAQRFGFSYEGVFRQAAVVKGENRDTAWFAMIDAEREALEAAWSAWLDPANFDGRGRQRRRLSEMTAGVLAARDPLA